MRLYLVQHGEAKSEEVDPDRPLTENGARRARQLAAFLRPLKLSLRAVYHSGKTRAEQTARILASALETARGLVQREGLGPKDPIRSVKDELAHAREDLMIVGHLPFLGKLASALLAGDESADLIAFHYGAVLCLERGEDGAWRARWMLVPDIVPDA